ncbi:MAG: hypothetical protein JU82_06890 [Sulfuricurvum sp. MLSB]|uniref:ATP-binding protein n=1 Tax=Sulfuricurvum sp. MLSB TaxID=1537917 RepID=UPI0005029B0F|nr:ATP-binding protein [Sulfuricurvum sp. MLSB]KFN39482.1 MAG: hypothetical protein JU82_06890 [Sulfuricurvum sp. MLSB]
MKHSVFLKITLLFIVIFIGAGIGFYAIHQKLDEEHERRLRAEAQTMLSLLRKSIIYPSETRKEFLRQNGYDVIFPRSDVIATLHQAFTGIPDTYPPEIQDSLKEGIIQILKDRNHLYVYLTRAKPPMLLVKADAAYRPVWPEAVFVTVLTALLLFYLLIIRALFPLVRLIRSIQEYGLTGRYPPIRTSRKDEIGLVSTALDNAMRQNQSLIEARQLFLRNIMHELKTPITVGKLALPFLKKGEEKSILEITSGALKPHIEPCDPKKLVEKAASLLFLQDDAVETSFDGHLIYADADALVSVFKNLIDNALKYSPDHTARIHQNGDVLVFSNRGEPWEHNCSLASLSEPFFHSRSNPESFGLGLYIVKSILDAHSFTIAYRYEQDRHCFEITCRNRFEMNG